MAKKKKRKKKKPIDWTQVLVELIVGLFTGIILLLFDKLLN